MLFKFKIEPKDDTDINDDDIISFNNKGLLDSPLEGDGYPDRLFEREILCCATLPLDLSSPDAGYELLKYFRFQFLKLAVLGEMSESYGEIVC